MPEREERGRRDRGDHREGEGERGRGNAVEARLDTRNVDGHGAGLVRWKLERAGVSGIEWSAALRAVSCALRDARAAGRAISHATGSGSTWPLPATRARAVSLRHGGAAGRRA